MGIHDLEMMAMNLTDVADWLKRSINTLDAFVDDDVEGRLDDLLSLLDECSTEAAHVLRTLTRDIDEAYMRNDDGGYYAPRKDDW